MQTKIERIVTEKYAMRYFRFGSGEKNCVILPGLSVRSVTLQADAVARQYRTLSAGYTTCLFDRRDDPPKVYTVSDMADDTADAMRALGLRDICLFGASQGGMIALLIAARHPDLVKKLVLGSTCAYIEDTSVIDRWIALAEKKDAEGLYLDFADRIYPPKVAERFRPFLLSDAALVSEEDLSRFTVFSKGTKGYDARIEMKNIACPVLVIGARDDRVMTPGTSENIVENLPKGSAELYMYDGFGHAAYDLAPEYKERMKAFFEK